MSVKYWDRVLNKWVIFPGTVGAPGKDAYFIAQENGYTGTKEEFADSLVQIPDIVDYINNTDDTPTKDSDHLVTSGGVRDALDELKQDLNSQINDTNANITEQVDRIDGEIHDINENITQNVTRIDVDIININNNITNIENDIEDINQKIDNNTKDLEEKINQTNANLQNNVTRIDGDINNINEHITQIENTTIPEAIQNSIVDNLTSDDTIKSLSARQGKILKEMIDNLVNFQLKVVESLPDRGESNIMYLVKKEGEDKDIHNEYIWIEEKWELLGDTDVDFSDYYNKSEIDSKVADLNGKIANNESKTQQLGQDVDTKIESVKDLITKETTRAQGQETELSGKITENTNSINDLKEHGNKTIHTLTIKCNENAVLNAWNGSEEATAEIKVPTKLSELTSTSDDIIKALGYTPSKEIDLSSYVQGPNSATGDNIVLFDNTTGKLIKDSGHKLSEYATQEWVRNQSFSSSNTWRPITVGNISLNDSSTTLTIKGGSGINLSFVNGTLTITNSSPGSGTVEYTLPVATDSTLGGIKIGYSDNSADIGVMLSEDDVAYVKLTDSAIRSALGFTPANVSDIPEIPIAIPNPYALNIAAGGSTTSYTGSSPSSINLDNIYAKRLPSVDTPGKPGLYFSSSGPVNVTEVYVTEDNPDAIILVSSEVTVTFGNEYYKLDGIDDLSGGTYKCYCITYIRGVVLVNGAIYG